MIFLARKMAARGHGYSLVSLCFLPIVLMSILEFHAAGYRSSSRTPRITAGFQVGVPASERGCTNTNSSPVSGT